MLYVAYIYKDAILKPLISRSTPLLFEHTRKTTVKRRADEEVTDQGDD